MQAAAHLHYLIPEPFRQTVWAGHSSTVSDDTTSSRDVQKNQPDKCPLPCTESASLIFSFEIATVMARCFAGQPVKSGAERARITKAAIERNRRDGQFAFRQ